MKKKRKRISKKSFKFLKWTNILNTLKNSFYSRVLLPNEQGCMEWIGALNMGYGVLRPHNKKQILAHRLSYLMHYGELRKEECVLHKCDNRLCVNPEHLSVGTKSENTLDMHAKNRGVKGEKCGKSKLTEKQVKYIKSKLQSGFPVRKLSNQFKVSFTCINYIKHNLTWRHI